MATRQPQKKIDAEEVKPPRDYKKFITWALIAIGIGLLAFSDFIFPNSHRLTQAELVAKARAGQVTEAKYDKDDPRLVVMLQGDDKSWDVDYPKALEEDTFRALTDAKVTIKPEKTASLVGSFIKFIIWLAIAHFLMGFAPSVKKMLDKLRGKADAKIRRPKLTLDDVKGMPEIVEELRNLIVAMANPEKAEALGARMPVGVILYGIPGTGKTMLAKAVAGELGVPFFEVKGSNIRTKWIGDAAKNIKELFQRARLNPLSVILFDEGDTIGGRRSGSDSGGSAEHASMVNELLQQMNYGQPGGHVFVIIVTNHPERLDEALTREGRIDLKLAIIPPDIVGRKHILEVHTKKKPLADDVNLHDLAKETYGFTGAALEVLANGAALQALKRDGDEITMADFNTALVIMRAGPANTSRKVSPEDRRVTAYHEAGHALLAAVQDRMPNPTGITILAHGQSGGHTMTVPDETDETLASQYRSRSAQLQELVMLMGGLVGEKLALDGDFTNRPSGDRREATKIATSMIVDQGMGTYNVSFTSLPGNWMNGPHAAAVLHEIEELMDEAEKTALTLILQYWSAYKALVEELLEKETLRAEDLANYRPTPEAPENLEGLLEKHSKLFAGIRRTPTSRTLQNGHAGTVRV